MRQNYIHSVNLNQDTNFPYLVLQVEGGSSVPRNPGFQVMHWHEDLQFIYLLAGKLDVITLETSLSLHEGEGVFLNKNVVHMVKGAGDCRYNSFIFPEKFLKFYPGSQAAAVVERLTEAKNFPVFPIHDCMGNAAVLAALQRLSALELEQHKTPLYPYAVLTALCTLWLELCRVADIPGKAPEKSATGERMTAFLRYIEQHYQEPITLEALAESAHVSKSECLRCFKAALQTAPYQYLMEYRLAKAAEQLRSTDTPIGEIAAGVGFGQPSHFGKCFREKTGMTPREYRRQNQQ